jgi:hypothetical protein
LFHAPGEEGTATDQDRTNALLRKSCEGRFEIAIGSGIHNKQLHAQPARRRLQVRDEGLETRDGRVRKKADRPATDVVRPGDLKLRAEPS